MKAKDKIEQMKAPDISIQKLFEYTRDSAVVVRANAVIKLAENFGSQKEVVDYLVQLARDRKNDVIAMGPTKLSHLIVGYLDTIGTEYSRTAVAHLIEEWPQETNDKSDLLAFLNRTDL